MRSTRLQLQMLVLLAATRLSLRSRDTSTTLRRLVDRHQRWPEFSHAEGLRAVRRAARLLRANCLAQSIALTVALTRMAEEPALILGCRRYQDRQWGAHAWVTVGATVLDALPSGEHEPLARLDAATSWVPAPVPAKERGTRRSG